MDSDEDRNSSASSEAEDSNAPDVVALRKARLQALVHRESHEGRTGLYFGSKLPAELLIRIASMVNQESLLAMTHTCWQWRRTLINEPRLWCLQLNSLNVLDPESVSKACLITKRTKGTLKQLMLNFDEDEMDMWHDHSMLKILRLCLQEISRHDGGQKLEKIMLDFSGFAYSDDLEVGYEAISLVLYFCSFAALNVKTFEVESALDRFPSGAPFFVLLPHLQHLVIKTIPDEQPDEFELPDVFSTIYRPQGLSCEHLTTLCLYGASLTDTHFPAMPCLKVIEFVDTRCDNLYELLSHAAWSLEDLRLASIVTKAPSQFMDTPRDPGATQDLPDIIALHRLRHLSIDVQGTPSFWSAPKANATSFIIEAFALKTISCSKSWIKRLDYEAVGYRDSDLYGYHPRRYLNRQELTMMFRQTPNLQGLDLSEGVLRGHPAIDLVGAMSDAGGATLLRCLILGSVATDQNVETLSRLAPNLSYLDVRNGSTTLPALARLGSRLRKGSQAQLQAWLAQGFKLTIVTNKPAEEPKASKLRHELRNLLITLSASQVATLATSLILDSPPNAPNFQSVKAEVFSLSSFTATRASAAILGDNVTGLRNKKGSKRPAATQTINEGAKTALIAWQKKREEEWSIEWFERTAGVELVWKTPDEAKDFKWDSGSTAISYERCG